MKKKSSKKILIVEDEKILAEMYLDKFAQAGFKVKLASEAREGLKIAKKEMPDLIILDILLPRENGIYLLRNLRKDPKTSSLKVVAFSNYDDPLIKKEAFSLGVEDYLIKTSYTPQQIIERVKDYLK